MNYFLKTNIIKKEWTDYNGHMNLSYYILVFDNAAEIILNKFKMGEKSALSDQKSTFAVETHTCYKNEVQLNDEVDINLIYCDHDKKRIQYKLEMIHAQKKYLAATLEALSLYVDLNERKVSEFEEEKVILMNEYILKNNNTFKTDNLKFSSKLKK